MITECSNCSGPAAELCSQAYKVSAQKVAGCAEDLVTFTTTTGSMLNIITKTRDHEINSLRYLSTVVIPGCSLSPQERELRLDEAIIEAGDTLSSS